LAEVCPFMGLRYNHQKVENLMSVICPPYDVISLEQQNAYYKKSEHNIIRLEHGMVLPGDNQDNNKHLRAQTTYHQWLNEHILQADPVPSFYIHEQTFSYNDTKKKRLGFTACIRLEPWESKMVFPHEHTVSGIKSDRLQLMRATGANFSPLLGLYDDLGGKIAKLLTGQTSRKPIIDISDGNEGHRVWMANEPEFVQRVSYYIAAKPIFIADGHHRYETALAYRDERLQGDWPHGDEAFNFVMMTLVSFTDPGLIALPVHRMVRGISDKGLSMLKRHLDDFFEAESIPLDNSGLPEIKGATTMALGLEPEGLLALRLRHSTSLEEIMPQERSDVYKRLDVSIVQHLIVDSLIAAEKNSNISYTPDATFACESVERGEFQLAFLLNPIPVTIIKTIAEADDRMPGKSTYFHPKLPTGLVINCLDGMLIG